MKWTNLLGLTLIFIVFLTISSIIEGFVISCLWKWFITPFGIAKISLLHAIGLGLITSFVTYHYYPFKKEDEVDIVRVLEYLLVRPVIVLVIGYFIKFLMVKM